jgi:hypothetical protein
MMCEQAGMSLWRFLLMVGYMWDSKEDELIMRTRKND